MILIGSLYKNNKCVKVCKMEILNLNTDEKRTVILDFDADITDYTCKVFLWNQKFKPICPKWDVSKQG